MYPFERFTAHAQKVLTVAPTEASAAALPSYRRFYTEDLFGNRLAGVFSTCWGTPAYSVASPSNGGLHRPPELLRMRSRRFHQPGRFDPMGSM